MTYANAELVSVKSLSENFAVRYFCRRDDDDNFDNCPWHSRQNFNDLGGTFVCSGCKMTGEVYNVSARSPSTVGVVPYRRSEVCLMSLASEACRHFGPLPATLYSVLFALRYAEASTPSSEKDLLHIASGCSYVIFSR
jgi:hypothetical protein